MKFLIAIIFSLAVSITFSQKVAKIIDKKDSAKLQKHFDKGGDVNETIFVPGDEDDFNVSLLSYSVHAECKSCLEVILEKKDVIEDFDLKLTEAFVYSLSVGNDEISNLLFNLEPLPKGVCDICHGNNALMVAATYGREDWYFKLKEQSDLTYVNNAGATLMHSAGSSSSQNIVEDIMKIDGLDINLKDAEGLTPLDYAGSNEENPLVFQTLIDNGADYKKAWNLLYWWCMYPGLNLTPEMIIERRADAWMIDEDGDNCLMLLSYFYIELSSIEAEVFENQFVMLIDLMIEDYNHGQSDLSFVPQFYQNGITLNVLNAMLFIEDFNRDEPIYPKYLEFLGLLCESAEFCPVYKKEYKRACKIYGEDLVAGWYEEFDLPID